jgi:hypothetical protein
MNAQKTRKLFSFFVPCDICNLLSFVKLKKYLQIMKIKLNGLIGLKYRVMHLKNICAS